MAEKRNIFLVGPMGAGKSTIGRYLAQQLHMEFLDSDTVIEQRTDAESVGEIAESAEGTLSDIDFICLVWSKELDCSEDSSMTSFLSSETLD